MILFNFYIWFGKMVEHASWWVSPVLLRNSNDLSVIICVFCEPWLSVTLWAGLWDLSPSWVRLFWAGVFFSWTLVELALWVPINNWHKRSTIAGPWSSLLFETGSHLDKESRNASKIYSLGVLPYFPLKGIFII